VKANCIIPTGQNLANIDDDMKKLVPEVVAEKSKEEITSWLEMLVRAYDPASAARAHARRGVRGVGGGTCRSSRWATRSAGDDGVGATVLAELAAARPSSSLRLADLGTDALALVDTLRRDEPCVVVDAARMGREPGAVAAFRPEDVRLRIRGDGLSVHGLGLAEAFALAGQTGAPAGGLLVVGVEPAGVTPGTDCRTRWPRRSPRGGDHTGGGPAP